MDNHSNSTLKLKLFGIAFVVISIALGILVYFLQFSTLSLQLNCQKSSGYCVLSREMVIGGKKEKIIPINSIKEVDISFHRHDHNLWLVTNTGRFTLGTYSSQSDQDNQIKLELQEFLYDPEKENFDLHWPE